MKPRKKASATEPRITPRRRLLRFCSGVIASIGSSRVYRRSSGDQPTTLVAVASSLGGFSKVWNGAGEGTSHSRPSAASYGFCEAFSPLPIIVGSTMKMKKYTCAKPKANAPTEAMALKSANCAG